MARIKDTTLRHPERQRRISPETITRQCVVCGEDILIKLFPKGKYIGGNYFSTVEQAENYRDTGETVNFDNGLVIHVSEPVGKITKWEYWECDECYRLPDTNLFLNR
jgi:hypothetical protein